MGSKSWRESGHVSFRTMQSEWNGRSVSHPGGVLPAGIHRGPGRYRDTNGIYMMQENKQSDDSLLSGRSDKIEFDT